MKDLKQAQAELEQVRAELDFALQQANGSELKLEKAQNSLGKLAAFSGIWHYPARVKCASLCWHTLKGALNKEKTVSTE